MSQQIQKKIQGTAPDTVRETDPNVQQGKASRPDHSVWVTASAGTGKTKVLTDRILRLLLPDADGRPGTKPSKILCLTYTKAGAGEMAIRLSNTLTKWAIAPEEDLRAELKKLQNREPGQPDLDKARQLFAEVADTPGGIKILTIHSFCQSVLGRFPLEAGIPPYFRPLQETDAAALLQQARDTILKKAEENKNSPLASALDRLARAVDEKSFFELIRSIAKERGQLERVMQSGADGVYKKLCGRLSVPPGREPEDMLKDACHSAAFDEPGLRAACRALAASTGKSEPAWSATMQQWLDKKETRTAEFESWEKIFLTGKGTARIKDFPTKGVAQKFPDCIPVLRQESERLAHLADRMNAAASALLTRDLLILGNEIVALYQSLKLGQAALDFDDLIFMTCALLEGRAEWVLYKLDDGIDHILVDEAQDTNPEQWKIVKALAKEFTAGAGASETERTIFVVGDEKQSIYSFQRAAPREFHHMRGWLSEKINDAEKKWDDVPMSISFRSTKSVLQAVDATFATPAMQDGVSESIIEHISHRRGQAGLVELWPLFETPETEDIAPWEPPVEITGFETGAAKLAAHIAKTIRGWMDDSNATLPARNRRIRAGDVMILFRTRNTLFRQVAKALKDEKIPISGADRMILNDQISVQDLFVCAEFALQPMDDLNLACLLKSPLIGISEEELFELAHPRTDKLWPALQSSKHKNIVAYLNTILKNTALGPFDFLTAILQNPCPADERSGLRAMQKRLGRDIMEPLDELLNAALDFESDNPPSLQLFLHRQSRGATEVKREMDESGDFVRLMTIHGAKGLQAPIIILPDTTRAVRGGNSKAERRLLWPDKTGFETPLWSPRAPEGYEEYDAALDAIEAEQDKEYRRLLYVAMTRAEDRLYLAGCSGTRQPLPDSWFFAMRAGLESLSDTELLADGTLHLENKQLAGKEPDRKDEKTEKTGNTEAPPSWLFTQAEPERPATPPLRPSKSEEPEQTINSPLQPDNIHRFRRGTLTHKLLQFLPAHSKEKRANAAREFLNRYAQDLPEKIRSDIAKETLQILGHPDFAAVFDPGSLAEVPVTGLLDDNRVVSGQIDRLLITDNEILIVDYKTNRPPPTRAEDVPVLYRNQMNAYAAILAKIYPGRTISCALLWTDGPTLMKLPPT
jgi:ATP-dependent helicase/nuclease subunit A